MEFGTSGLRGPVFELTDEVVAAYILAFLNNVSHAGRLYLGRDLRPSSLRLAQVVARAATDYGLKVENCGELPTPALAFVAQGYAAIMVTGSHIPADRNGLKFYSAEGELTKAEEYKIAASAAAVPLSDGYWARYRDAFGPKTLQGLRLGVYLHSSVGGLGLVQLLRDLGAEVYPFGASERFIAVDTEAIAPSLVAMLQAEVRSQGYDALISLDGDADRPLVFCNEGHQITGDVIGQIAARRLEAEVIVTPISSGGGLEVKAQGVKILRTKIGSPYVIEAMRGFAGQRVVGYEANGGFILGFSTRGLTPLWTRDAVLPLLLLLEAAQGGSLSALVREEAVCFVARQRLENIPRLKSNNFLCNLDAEKLLAELGMGRLKEHLDIDGVMLQTDESESILLRASGNAPEFRVQIEAASRARAEALLARAMTYLAGQLI